ncbi:HYR domain-containing protein [Desulfonema limicola]|uniref:HYR domain-containing protein n=2 Tax=Desulfonema limicola TaxID=45656 RepID=A0A975GHY0_9BACT|nr:HYR domain-containing protein [Desulfonema limicola]
MFDGIFNAGTGTVKLTDANHTITGGNGSTVTFNNLIMEPLTAPRTITIGRSIQPMVLAVNGDFISGSSAASQVTFVKAHAGSNVTNPVTSYYCASNGGIANITCLPGGPPSPGYGSTPAPGSTLSMTTTQGTNGTSTLTVSETGNAALNITGITVTGTDAAKFTPSPTSFSIADGGADQNVTVTCDASSVGTFTNATLNVAHNATGSPATYPLSCTVNPAAPTVSSVSSTTANGSYKAGDTVSVTVTFSESVTVTGTPQLTLNPGTPYAVNYSGGSGTDTLTFDYTVSAGHNSTDLDYEAAASLALNGGTIKDTATGLKDAVLTLPTPGAAGSLGTNKAIVIDTTAPAISSVTSSTANGTYGTGATVSVTVNFSENVTLAGGNLTVNLDTGGTAVITPFGPANTASATYTVAAGENSSDLNSASLTLAGGATLRDAAGNDAALTIPAGQSIADSKAIVIDTTAPAISSVTSSTADGTYGAGSTVNVTVNFSEKVTLAGGTLTVNLDTGGTAVISAIADSNTASGTYTVAAGHNSTDLNSSSLVLAGGATLKDTAGNNAALTIPAGQSIADSKAIVIDTTAPAISSVTSSTADGTYGAGSTVNVTVNFSEKVTLAGGSLTVNLDTGGTAVISAIADSNTASGTYTVAAGHNSTDLNSSSLVLAGGATLKDAAGNNAALTIPAGQSVADSKAIVIDTTAPAINSFARQTPAAQNTNADTLIFRVTFNENVKNVDTADFSVNSTSTATVTGVTTATPNSVYDVTISGGNLASFNGSLGLNLSSSASISDTAGNALPASEPSTDETYTLDNTATTVTINQAAAQTDPSSISPVNFTVVFNKSVTGFTNADISLSGTAGAATSAVTGSGTTYNVAVSGMTASGTVTASVNADAAQDSSGNNSAASTSTDNTINYNNAPSISGTYTFTSINEDTTSTGVKVSAVLADAGITAADTNGDTLGIAVTGITGNGTWQFSSDSTNGTDGTWTAFNQTNTPADTTALLLNQNAWIRYIPDSINSETAGLTFRAWDQTTGTSSASGTASYADTSTNGGASAWSTTTGTGTLTVTSVNDIPTLTAFAAVVDTTPEDIEVEITFAELAAQGDEADADGTVDAFVVQAVSTGTLKIGTSSAAAADYALGTIDTIDSTNNAYWTPAANANGTLNALELFAQDNSGAESVTAGVIAQVSVTAENDAPVLAALEAAALAYTENDGAVSVTSAITVSDADSTNITGAAIAISTGFATGEDVLAFTDAAPITGSFDSGTGILTLTGSDTLANYQAALRAVTYENTSENPDTTTRTLTFTVNDGASDSNQPTRDINITAENDAPVLAALEAAAVEYTENDGAAAITSAITVSDADSTNITGAAIAISTGFATGEDVLAFTDAAPITGSFDSGTGILTLTGSDTLANYQAALRAVTYKNTSENPDTTTRTLTFTVNDGASDSNQPTRDINITAENDAPVLAALEAAAITYTENDGAVSVTSAITVSDADSTNITGAAIAISTGFATGEDVLAFTDAAPITGSFDSGTGILTLTGSDTLANYQAALRAVTYKNTSENPDTTTRTLTFTVNDGTADSNLPTRDINITAENDAPVLAALEAAAVEYTENDGAVSVTSAITVSDADSTNITGAAIAISTGFATGEDVLAFTDAAPITGSFDSGTGILTLTGSDTLANYQAALRAVTYKNTSENPDTTTRTLTFTVNDGASDSNQPTRDINITAENDAPVLAALEAAAVEYTENDGAAAITSAITVSDADSTNITGAAIEISTGFVTGEDVLAFTDAAPITGSFDSGTGILTLTGSDTLANYQAALRAVTYENTSENPDTTTRTLTFTVNDGASDSNQPTRDINITAENDAPVLAALEAAAVEYTENDGAVAITSAITVSDADSTNITGAAIEISSGFVTGEDVLAFTDAAPITGSFDSGTGILTLTGSDTLANYQAALRAVTYKNTSENPDTTTRTLTFTVNDGASDSNQPTRDINITAENDAPVLAALEAAAVEYTENDGAVAITSAITVSDADSTNITGAAIEISSGFVTGEDVLAFTDAAPITGSFDSGTGILTLTGSDTLANYQAALRAVTYKNTSENPDTTTRTLTFTVNDGASDSNQPTRDINITAENDAPVLAALEAAAVEYTENDGAAAITSAITVSDADSTNITGAAIEISTGFVTGEDVLAFTDAAPITGSFDSGTGILTLTGSDTLANYQAALRAVTYENTSENPDTTTRTLTFTVNDGASDSNQPTRDINITAENDAPVLAALEAAALAYTENDGAVSVTSAITVSDADSTNITGAAIAISTGFATGEDVLAFTDAAPITGSFDSGTGILTLTGSDTLANYQAALRAVTYKNTSENPDTTTRTLTFTVNDGASDSNQPTRDINITAENDAPVLAALEAAALAYTENDGAVAVTSAITVSDADSTNITGAAIEISTGFATGEDILAFTDAAPITGSFDSGTGILTLTGSDTLANYQAALRAVTYKNTSENPDTTTRTLTFTVNDGASDSNQPTRDINITAENDAPVLAALEAAAVEYTENDGVAAVTSAITVSDADSTNITGAAIAISTGFATGEDVLAFTDAAPITGSFDSGTGILTLTGSDTLANYQAALRAVTYKNTSENPDTTTRTLTFTVNDGASDSNQPTRDINITAENDAPVLAALEAAAVEYTENDGAVAVTSAITVSDADSTNITGAAIAISTGFATGEDVLAFTDAAPITGSFDSGTGILTLTGSDTLANYQAALQAVTYENTSENPDTTTRTLTFTVNDGASDSNQPTRDINITAENDAPTFTSFADPVDTTNEDTEVEITFAELAAQGNEADADGTVDAFVVQAVSTGTLKIGTDAATAAAFDAVTNNTIDSTKNAYWTPASNANGSLNALELLAKDNSAALSLTAGVIAKVSVTPVNDIPTLTAFAAVVDTTPEDTEVEITFAELETQGDEADADGTVTAFVVKAVSTGTLKIGTDAATAAAFDAVTNNTIDSTKNAYWTPASNANGSLNALELLAKDNSAALSLTAGVIAKVSVTAVNDIPTLTAFAAVVDTTPEDTEVEITFAELETQGDEADADGTVTAFVVKAVSTGTLKIGTSSTAAAEWSAGTNDTIDSTKNAFWTPALNANSITNALELVAKDNSGDVSVTAGVIAKISVTDKTAPVITCPADINLPAAGSLTPVIYTATALDNIDPAPVITFDIASGSDFQPGTTPVTVKATDASGNFSECTFMVTIDEYDFGDTPDPALPTLLANDGARHKIDGVTFLGTGVDSETDGHQDKDALGDDNNGNDDEDGVAFTSSLIPETEAIIDITASVSGLLNAWIDFNADGDWEDTGDQIFIDKNLSAGVNTLSFTVPADAKPGTVFARFRFSTSGGISYTGAADNGEVEDYAVSIESPFIPSYTISVNKTGLGTGTVSSTPAGIDCGDDCEQDYNEGTEITLTAVPESGSNFTGWTGGGCTGTGDCIVTMNAAETVTATFEITTVPQHTLTLTKDGTGTGKVSSEPAGIDCGTDCNQDYDQGTEITLTAVPESGSNFTGWTGGGCTGTGDCIVTLNTAETVTATFEITTVPQHTLTLTKDGTGTGKVSSEPAGIDCGTDCNQDYDQGTEITLTAVPESGSNFTGWTGGGCTGTGDCIVTMNAAETVTATFEITTVPQHTLTLTKDGTGTGKVSSEPAGIDCGTDCNQDYDQGTEITLTAVPESGSNFTGWTGGGCTGTGDCIVTMNAAETVTATFEITTVPQHTLTLTKDGTGTGKVSSEPAGIDCGTDCNQDYDQGTEITLTAVPESGSNFTGWTGGGCTGTGDCIVTMNAAETVTATFEITTVPQHTLTLTKDGTGTGKVSSEPAGIDCGTDCDQDYDQGTEITLTAVPESGSNFTGWTGGGCTGTGNCIVTLNAAETVTATFEITTVPQHTLTLTKDGTGTGKVSSEPAGIDCGTDCNQNYDQGTEITLTAVPESGSNFTGWTGGGCTGTGNCIVTLNAAETVTATFEITTVPQHTLTLTKDGTGTGKVSSEPAGIDCGTDCDQDYDQGTEITLTAVPESGSNFTGWTGGGCTGTGNCIVTLNAAETVTATFEITTVPQHTLTLTKDGTGTGKVSSEPAGIDCGTDCNQNYDQGTEITLTAVPESGSNFTGWTGGGCTGTGDCIVTMNAAETVTATFEITTVPQHTLTLTKDGTGTGKVSSEPAGIDCGTDCNQDYDQGTEITLTAVPESGSNFTGWTGGGCTGTGNCIVTLNAAETVTATFEITTVPQHTLTLTKDGTGTGKVSSEPAGIDCGTDCNQDYDQGTEITLTAVPESGSNFTGWTGGGCTGTGNCIVTLNAAETVTAAFNKTDVPVIEPEPEDSDGIPGWWEVLHGLNPNDPSDAAEDTDKDGLTNLEEFISQTNPKDADTDADGMTDGWEKENNLDPTDSSDADKDPDTDGLTNLEEFISQTNPKDADTDADGMTDGWEKENNLDPTDSSDADKDPDTDGLTNLEEFISQTNPKDADTDADGMTDGWEKENNLDPTDSSDAGTDPDGDGMTNIQEFSAGTNPQNEDSDNDGFTDLTEINAGTNPLDNLDKPEEPKNTDDEDSDGDGMENGWENQHGLNPDNPSDGIADNDGDHRNNRVEYAENTNPQIPDTYEASHMFNDEGFMQDEGFVLHVISEFANGFTMKIDTPEGEQLIIPEEYTGTGTAENPFTYNWKPGTLFTERRTDDPLPGDVTYKISFRFYADGSNLPFIYNVTWADYATADDKAADTPKDQQDFEALYQSNLHRITQMERIFDPSVPSEFNYTIKDIEGKNRPAVIKIPAIPYENLLIDNAEQNNLGYDPDADTFDIDPDIQEDMKLVPGDLLRLKIGSYNFSDTPAEGVTITFEAATGKYKGYPVRYNPIRHPDGSGRNTNAPKLNLPIQLNPEAEAFKVLKSMEDASRLLSVMVNETGDGTDGFVKADVYFEVSEDGLVIINISHLTSIGFIIEDADKDGMPDDWENKYGLDMNEPADANEDADGDGMTNLEEFTADSDPKVNLETPEPETAEPETENDDGGGSGGWCFISASQSAAMPFVIRIFGAIIAGMAVIKRFQP